MPITEQQAWDATDPRQTAEQRELAAKQILAGVAAQDAYWESRPELERLKALSMGGPQVLSHAEINPSGGEDLPTGGGDQTAIEGTSEDLSSQPSIGPADASGNTPTDPSDSDAAADKLRAQLTAAGITPEA